ncbi:MAG: hypothetical protein M1826_004921 [Phylliscum demangeonii]|nr:MAG: hypothetical protein M1826_004921 [Phylliscum demangeonii]
MTTRILLLSLSWRLFVLTLPATPKPASRVLAARCLVELLALYVADLPALLELGLGASKTGLSTLLPPGLDTRSSSLPGHGSEDHGSQADNVENQQSEDVEGEKSNLIHAEDRVDESGADEKVAADFGATGGTEHEANACLSHENEGEEPDVPDHDPHETETCPSGAGEADDDDVEMVDRDEPGTKDTENQEDEIDEDELGQGEDGANLVRDGREDSLSDEPQPPDPEMHETASRRSDAAKITTGEVEPRSKGASDDENTASESQGSEAPGPEKRKSNALHIKASNTSAGDVDMADRGDPESESDETGEDEDEPDTEPDQDDEDEPEISDGDERDSESHASHLGQPTTKQVQVVKLGNAKTQANAEPEGTDGEGESQPDHSGRTGQAVGQGGQDKDGVRTKQAREKATGIGGKSGAKRLAEREAIERWRQVPDVLLSPDHAQGATGFVHVLHAMTKTKRSQGKHKNEPIGYALASTHLDSLCRCATPSAFDALRGILKVVRRTGLMRDRDLPRRDSPAPVGDPAVDSLLWAVRRVETRDVHSNVDRIRRRRDLFKIQRTFEDYERRVSKVELAAYGLKTSRGVSHHNLVHQRFVRLLHPECLVNGCTPLKDSWEYEGYRVQLQAFTNMMNEARAWMALAEELGEGVLILYPPSVGREAIRTAPRDLIRAGASAMAAAYPALRPLGARALEIWQQFESGPAEVPLLRLETLPGPILDGQRRLMTPLSMWELLEPLQEAEEVSTPKRWCLRQSPRV